MQPRGRKASRNQTSDAAETEGWQYSTSPQATSEENMKYNKKMFLDYASAFDYTEDFYNNAEENHGKPITWEQAIKENNEFMKSMNCWSLKDFQKWFDFRKFEIEE